MVESVKGIDMGKRTIVDARADDKGVITHVKFDGNQTFTSIERAIPIVEREGCENAHVVKPPKGAKHLRTHPDGRAGNNLDEMAKS